MLRRVFCTFIFSETNSQSETIGTLKIEQLHALFLESKGVCTDTRKITQNCIFIALKGENFNGNEFAGEALEKGASYAVIDDIRFHENTGKTILTGDALKTLQKLATYHRNSLDIPIVALTGSNGKTTTKELINAVLSKKFKTTATTGNLNNHIGVPLTLLSMNDNTEMGIVEMGANHQGEIAMLSEICQPDYGYITNFGKAHLEGFGGVEGVIKGKSELYKFIKKHNKTVFVNGNDPKQMELTEELKRITFGNEEQDHYTPLKEASNTVVLELDGLKITSRLIGLYNVHNIAAAVAIGAHFGVTAEEIKSAIEAYVPEMNRSQILKKNNHTIILDAYNANPTSMMAALKNFQQAEGNNKLLILGDMFELGEEAKKEHQAITSFLEQNPFGQVLLVGANFYDTTFEAGHMQRFPDFEALKTHLESNPPQNNFMLLKGSRGMALERVLDLI